jgi:NodT family efflux transporter outer membrane factor (OMF) lipoprotein
MEGAVEQPKPLCQWKVQTGAAVAVAGLALAGCAVGPDFHRPLSATPPAYTSEALPPATVASPGTAGHSQHFVASAEIPRQWWKLFHSEPLNRLIEQAFSNSPTVAAAQAALREAEENRRAGLGALFPQVDADFTARRNKISGAAFGQPGGKHPPFTLYNASVNVSYGLDIFGGARRELEALEAQVDYQRFQAEGTYLTLSSNIVTSAVQEGALRAQIEVTNELVALQQMQLALQEVRFENGASSEIEVSAQRALLAQTVATLPPLEKELSQTRHLLAVLAGRTPNEAAGLADFRLDNLQLPEELPVSLPSALVHQRPDILAAEGVLHAASAQVGVATANLYPQLTISGSYGSESVTLGSLFGPGTSVWNVGGGIVQPLFKGGELLARRRAAIAAFEQAEAQYRQTVLQAFQDVADVLRALDRDAVRLRAQADAVLAAKRTLELTEEQLRFGAVSYLSLLDADRQYQQARLNLVQAQAARLADTAALFHALGGGWWNKGETKEAQPPIASSSLDGSRGGAKSPLIKGDSGGLPLR